MDLLKTIINPTLLRMKEQNLSPLSIQQTTIDNYILSNFVYEIGENLITNSVFTGISKDKNLSLTKGLCEFIERNAFKSGIELGLEVCATERSDGFAAYPNYPDIQTGIAQARANALNEAIERFVWATWWDNNTACDTQILLPESVEEFAPLLKTINEYTPIETIYKIVPRFTNSVSQMDSQLVIFFVKLKDRGYLSAGAAGLSSDVNSIFQRSFSELLRHSLAYHKYLVNNISPKSLYEKRLVYFANGEGNSDVDHRLKNSTEEPVCLPDLKFDQLVPHAFQDLISVYRCLFKNQPPFIGGALERLCL
jgi:hypothetical protein